MASTNFRTRTALYSSALRNELTKRNREFAGRHRLPFVETYGSFPVIVYEPCVDTRSHGNFHPAAYGAICGNPPWNRRLEKAHAQGKSSLPRTQRKWCELDSSMSSDALLMNIFCHPETLRSRELLSMLGVESEAVPEFGVRAHVPLSNGAGDRTEIDMRLGALLVEAKLTESDFQRKSQEIVERYRDLVRVFDRRLLPISDGAFDGYQLIRNVLAAHSMDSSFCVLLDARRPDLLEQWYAVMRAVKDAVLRVRCKVLTWQELTPLLPSSLQAFLDEKYGIVQPGVAPSPVITDFASHSDQ